MVRVQVKMKGGDILRTVVRDGRNDLEEPGRKGVPYTTWLNMNVAVYTPVHGAIELLLWRTTMPLIPCFVRDCSFT